MKDSWDECIERAKYELGVTGWVPKDEWQEVIDRAKEMYWKGDDFNELKEETIKEAGRKCELCNKKNKKLTAHHIYYGSDTTIAVCNKCHNIIHSNEFSQHGFILQAVLDNISNGKIIPGNIGRIAKRVGVKLLDKCYGLEKRGGKN